MVILRVGQDEYAIGKPVRYPSHYRDSFVDIGDVHESGNLHCDSEFATAIRKVQNAIPNRGRCSKVDLPERALGFSF